MGPALSENVQGQNRNRMSEARDPDPLRWHKMPQTEGSFE